MGRVPKPEVLDQLVEISLDEFNNGHHIKDLPEFNVAFTRYPFERKPTTAKDRLSKGVGFRTGAKKDAWMEKAEAFAKRNHRFRYCAFERTEDTVLRFRRKTSAISRLIIESYLGLEHEYSHPDKLIVVMDGPEFGRGDGMGARSKAVVEENLREYGLESEVFFRVRADQGQKHPAAYIADRLAYLIAVMYRDSLPRLEWPFPERRVDLSLPLPVTADELRYMARLLKKGSRGGSHSFE